MFKSNYLDGSKYLRVALYKLVTLQALLFILLLFFGLAQ